MSADIVDYYDNVLRIDADRVAYPEILRQRPRSWNSPLAFVQFCICHLRSVLPEVQGEESVGR